LQPLCNQRRRHNWLNYVKCRVFFVCIFCISLLLNHGCNNMLSMVFIIVNKMVKFDYFSEASAQSCAGMFSFDSVLFSFNYLMWTNFGNCRRKLDRLVSFVAKDWQICLVVVVKTMRGCLWLSICQTKHLQNTFSTVIARFMHMSSFLFHIWNQISVK